MTTDFDRKMMKRAKRLSRMEIQKQQLAAIEGKLHEIDPDARVLGETIKFGSKDGARPWVVSYTVAFQGKRRRMKGEGPSVHEARVAALDAGIQLRLFQQGLIDESGAEVS